MALFANRGISIAVNDARQEIRELALERNEKNASYAASALEAKMGRLFGLLESEAGKSQFATLLTKFESALGKNSFQDWQRKRLTPICWRSFCRFGAKRVGGISTGSTSSISCGNKIHMNPLALAACSSRIVTET